MGRRGRIWSVLILLAVVGSSRGAEGAPGRPNVLLITVDDMNHDTPGFAGNRLEGVTPNLDRLAAQSTYFRHAHVSVAVCQPSRSVLMTGRYPHRNGADGFKPINRDVPTLTESTRGAGYLNGIIAKTTHLAPPEKFCWDVVVAATEVGQGRDPESYYKQAKGFFDRAKSEGKPFFLMANSQDPHRPFHGSAQEQRMLNTGAGAEEEGAANANRPRGRRQQQFRATTYPSPGRTYSPEEVTVPAFLPDLPEVRVELAQYYSSAHRADQTVGAVLRALEEAGAAENTLVVFLSDNGISEPFAKSNCYLTSTRTPWLIRWPAGKVPAGKVDETHMISGIDLLPTVLDALKLPVPAGADGASILPLLREESGGAGKSRGLVFTSYNETSARKAFPMRCVQSTEFGYIFNGWADGGKTLYRSEPMGGVAYAAMKKAAATRPAIAARVEVLEKRTAEELYDLRRDPGCLNNLAGDAKYREKLVELRGALAKNMEATSDPVLEAYRAHLAGK